MTISQYGQNDLWLTHKKAISLDFGQSQKDDSWPPSFGQIRPTQTEWNDKNTSYNVPTFMFKQELNKLNSQLK